jgi:hypothetical protein
MSNNGLRDDIIKKLAQIEDSNFLNALKLLIDSKVNDGVFILSQLQKERVKHGRVMIKEGETFSHEEVQREMDKWLGTK